MPLSKTLANFLLFQLGWFACVLGGAGQWHWVGTMVVILIAAWHLSSASDLSAELKLLVSALVIGVCWESFLVGTQLLQYGHGQLVSSLAPHWIVAMWVLFATTFNVSLRWLKQRWMLAAVLGAVGGPMAFLAGQKLDAVVMPNTAQALIILSVGWMILTPILVLVSERFDGFRAQTRGETV